MVRDVLPRSKSGCLYSRPWPQDQARGTHPSHYPALQLIEQRIRCIPQYRILGESARL
jgi:hypothetical protein